MALFYWAERSPEGGLFLIKGLTCLHVHDTMNLLTTKGAIDMSNNETLLKQLSLIDTIISNYNQSNLVNYSRLLGFETALDIHLLSENNDYKDEHSNCRLACDILSILSKRYESSVEGFFFTTNKGSSIYESTEDTFNPESIVSDKYVKHVLDILEKGKVKLSYKSEIKNFESFESLLKKNKEYFYNMKEDHYYYDMKNISSFAFFEENHIIDRFNKIKRGTGFMERRNRELSRSIPFCLFSEKIAYFASENLSKKYSEMFIDNVRDRTYRLQRILVSVKNQEDKGIVFSKEYKDYLDRCKENLETFALFALNKKTSSFYGLQNIIIDLLHIDKRFALDIVCKTNLLSYSARDVLRKKMV